MNVNGIGGFNAVSPSLLDTKKIGNNENAVNFGEYLKNALNNVSDLEIQSETINNEFAAGKIDNIHDVMIAAEKADISLQLTMQIRNKIMDAYNEIMRIQI